MSPLLPTVEIVGRTLDPQHHRLRDEDLLDRGVYYGAGRSQAARCSGDGVVVVGAGNSAGQALMNLAGAGAHATMAVRGGSLGERMSAYLVDRVRQHPLIDVRLHARVTALDDSDDRSPA